MVTSADRRTMCNWSYDIVDACQIDREVAVIGMNYFYRYMSLSTTAADTASSSSTLSSTAPTTRKSFQLTYITCLIIALKCRGGLQVDSDFVSTTICQGIYQPSEIISKEIEILKVLGWKLNNGSVHDYINGMLELLPPPTTTDDSMVGDDNIRQKIKAELKCSAVQIVEKQMLDYTIVCNTSPSVMAYSALLVALSSSSTTSSSSYNRRRERRLLNPQDRRRWLDNINIVLGIKSTDYNVQSIYDTMMMGCEDRSSSSCSNIVEMSSSPMSTTTPSSRYNNSVPPTPTPSRCYTYCTPISSASSSPSIPPRMNCNGVRVEEENDEGGKTTSKSRSSSLTSSEYADLVFGPIYTYGAERLYLDMLSMTSGSGSDDDDDDGW